MKRKSNQLTKKRPVSRPKKRRQSRAKSAAHFVRALVMEGLGIVVLVMLYLTIQSTSANESLKQGEQPASGDETQANVSLPLPPLSTETNSLMSNPRHNDPVHARNYMLTRSHDARR